MIQRALAYLNSIIPHWFWNLVLSMAAVLAILIFCLVLALAVRRVLRVKQLQQHGLRITNQGNVRSVYHLQVLPGGAAALSNGKEDALRFKMLMNQIPLVEVEELEPEIEEEVELPAQAQHAQVNAPKSAANGISGSSMKKSGGAAKQAGKKVSEKSGMLANFMGALGNLIPGAAGQQLKQQGAAVRGVQTKTNQTMQKQDSAVRKVEAVQKGPGQISGKAPAPKPAEKSKQVKAADPSEPPVAAQPLKTHKKTAPALSGYYTAQTCEVEPGESITVELQISPRKVLRSEATFLYTIRSRQEPLEKIDRQAEPLFRQGMVHFPAVAPWRTWLPAALNLLIVLGSLLGLALCLVLIWS